MVCLIKPQFEAGREKVGKKGVVRDKKVHEEVIEMVTNHALSLGFIVKGLEHSGNPRSGGKYRISSVCRKSREGAFCCR